MSGPWDAARDEVRARADIAEVIGGSVVLKRRGRNLLGLCPFHKERTPSFNVMPERGIFRCFGCGEGGDVFAFVMKHDNLGYREALERLAERYGVPLPAVDAAGLDRRSKLREANEAALAFFQEQLRTGDTAAEGRIYLEGRGISQELARRFQLGWAPPGWDGLLKHLEPRGLGGELAEAAGLARPRPTGGGRYDALRARVVIPIHDAAGRVVGFGGRAVREEDQPKYLNTPETELFKKGELLFGLHQARPAIKAADEALLMEGYMDVLMAHAHGLENAVATLGTALTHAQARLLLQNTPSKRVVVAYDADAAGQAAAERGLGTLGEVAQGVGLNARVLSVPAGKDPDAYLRAEGSEAFRALIAQATPLWDFLLDRALKGADRSSPEGRAAAVGLAVPILATIQNPVLRDEYLGRVAERLAVREEAVRRALAGIAPQLAGPLGPPPGRPGGVPLRGPGRSAEEAARILLALMLEHAEVRDLVAAEEPAWPEPFDALAHQLMLEADHAPPEALAATWLGALEDGPLRKEAAAIAMRDVAAWGAEPMVLASDGLNALAFMGARAELDRVKARLKREGGSLPPEALAALEAELRAAQARAMALQRPPRHGEGA